jgi:hypothetical protein
MTSPCVGFTRPFVHRSKVDFPAPDGPSNTRNWPFGAEMLVGNTARMPLG